MFIARWHVEARFGYKQKVLVLMREWEDKIGKQVGWGRDRSRLITGSIGAREAVIENEIRVASLAELDEAFSRLAKIEGHADWSSEMEKYVVSGSTYWEIFREVD